MAQRSHLDGPAPEALARKSGRCRLCHERIRAGEDYVALAKPIGWVHATCAIGYRAAMAENREAA